MCVDRVAGVADDAVPTLKLSEVAKLHARESVGKAPSVPPNERRKAYDVREDVALGPRGLGAALCSTLVVLWRR